MKILFFVSLALWLSFVINVFWINSKTVKTNNPFFTDGITITIEGKKYELGFREDGVVVWRHSK